MNFPSEEKSIFEYANSKDTASKFACNVFSTHKYTEYEIAYKEAGDLLIEMALEDKSLFQVVSIYPIAFLYRQFIELFIKDLLLKHSAIFANDKKLQRSHDLYQLWGELLNLVRSTIVPLSCPNDTIEFYNGLIGADAYIEELSLVDRNSMAFRYPDDKTHTQPYFPNEIAIDLINIKDRMDELYNIFEFIERRFKEVGKT